MLSEVVDSLAAETGFAGVVSVDRGGEIEFARAYGFACRANQVPNTTDTRFAIASGVKGLTALTVVSLIERDALRLSTTARSVLGADLPLIGDDVAVEHLLAHRSGIGDFADEEAGHEITEYVLTVPAQELATTEQYLAVLDGYPAKTQAYLSAPSMTRRHTSRTPSYPIAQTGRGRSPPGSTSYWLLRPGPLSPRRARVAG